ncbi:MAG: response regulator [Candidatus Bathyarchaeia archaeon]
MDSTKKTILIIDDDAGISRAFSRILQKNGYITDTAETGEEALQKATKQSYAAALIDVCLPDLNGASLTSRLQQLNGKMIKIIITGFPVKAPKNMVDACLVKPVAPEKLLATLQEKLRQQT